MKQITNIRKAVCIMANQLKKAGYSLSEAFRKAWRRVKLSMTIRAAGTSFENRQERLSIGGTKKERTAMTITIWIRCRQDTGTRSRNHSPTSPLTS